MIQLGPTGNFPEGKMDATDEGELCVAIYIQDFRIILNFGGPVSWIGITSENAQVLANKLLDLASDLENQRNETI